MAQQYEFQVHVSGPELDRTGRLPVGRAVTIGRQAGNVLQLDHFLVSRQHAQIHCTADECQITDLGSANGTLVDGEKLTPQVPTPLRHQSVIQIGPFQLTVRQVLLEQKAESVIGLEPVAEPEPVVEPEPVEEPEAPPVVDEAPPPPTPPTLPTAPMPPADDSFMLPGLNGRSHRLLNYLPGIYHTDFMARFLALFESILMPIEWNVDNFDLYLSPRTAPAAFVPWLANWFDLTFDDSWSEMQRRTLLAEAHQIYARRGTKLALSRVLEIYTGHRPEIIDLAEDQDPFIFTVKLPPSVGEAKKDLIERLIDAHKPAHTSYELLFE